MIFKPASTVNYPLQPAPVDAQMWSTRYDMVESLRCAMTRCAKSSVYEVRKTRFSLQASHRLNMALTHFYNCRFTEVRADKSSFAGCVFVGCDFRTAVFTDCNFKNVKFLECCLSGARFLECNLESSDLVSSRASWEKNGRAEFNNCNITNALGLVSDEMEVENCYASPLIETVPDKKLKPPKRLFHHMVAELLCGLAAVVANNISLSPTYSKVITTAAYWGSNKTNPQSKKATLYTSDDAASLFE